MSDRLRSLERAEVLVVSVVLAVAVLGLTLLPLTSSLFVRTLVTAVHAEELTGLGREQTQQAAEDVRRFVLDEDAPPLPAAIDGRSAFDASATSHLVDVRRVLLPARFAALLGAVMAAAWAMLRGRQKRFLLAGALSAAGWMLGASLALAALVGVSDFDAFFTWFHGLFFAAGTWQFPADALLIQVFPLPFWMSAAAIWGGLVLASVGLLFSFAHRCRFTRTTDSV